MNVDWVITATWGPLTTSGGLQHHYFQIPFSGAPNILASAYLAEVSVGASNDVAGVSLASFKSFQFLDDNGKVQETEVTSAVSNIQVERCVTITIALDIIDATALGGWTFYGQG